MEKQILEELDKEREKLKTATSKEAGEIQKRIQDLTNTLLWWRG